MMTAISAHELVQVHIEIEGLPPDALAVSALEGREAISQLFEIEVHAVSTGVVDAEGLLGLTATLIFERGEQEVCRLFGMVARVRDGFESESDHTSYHILVVPRAYRMTLHETLDIFMDLTVPEILEKKLELARLEKGKDYELRLYDTYPKREFVVQYRETDLAFVSRLTEHLGISFFFEHRDGRDVIVFTDLNSGFRAISEPGRVPFRPRGDLRDVYRLESMARLIPSEYLVRDYNYRTPQVELAARADVNGAGGRVVEYGSHFKTNEEAGKIAKIRSEEQVAGRRVLEGESDVALLGAGARFLLEGHLLGDLDLLVTEVTHSVKQVALGSATDARRYSNRFRAIPRSTAYRPPRVTPKPKVHGVLTGVVDASNVSQYAELDSEGRYHVKFMFDTSDVPGGQASRPVRMMQPHSGAGYGMHFPLRAGVEVLIVCVDGDPDRPIIAGTVPNPRTASPVVSGNAPRNIIRTGGNNEINIDDTEDGQRIKITTPRRNTLLQLGANNDPIDGISLKTEGHAATVATEGSSQWNSFGTQMSTLVNLLRSGVVLNIASKPNLLNVASAALDMAQMVVVSGMPGVRALYDRNASWIKQEQQRLYQEETEINAKAVEASQAAKGQMEECNACKLAAKKLLPAKPAPQNPAAPTDAEKAAMKKYDDVMAAIAASDAASAATDDSFLSAIGTQEDRNGIIDVNRQNFFNANFEPVMYRDAYSSISQYDYAKFAALKAKEDEARWNNFNEEQKKGITDQGITKEQWLAAEKEKWVTTPVGDEDLAYYHGAKGADDAAFEAQTTAQKNAIPAELWEAAGIPADKVGNFAALTDEEKAALQAAWVADQQAKLPTPDLKTVRGMRNAELEALLGSDPLYANFKNKLADCKARCEKELDDAREKAIQTNEDFAKKMKENTARLHELQDLSNKNDEPLVKDFNTAINALIQVMALLELYFARTSVIERWTTTSAEAALATTVQDIPASDLCTTLAGATTEIAKLSIPIFNPQCTNVVGSEKSTEVYGQRDLMMWSETAVLLGMGSKDRFTSKLGAAGNVAASVVGVPLPGDKPDPSKGKVIIMGMQAVHVLSKGNLRVQAETDAEILSRGTASMRVKKQLDFKKTTAVELKEGEMELSVWNNEAVPLKKASLQMSLAGDKGVVELKTAGNALKMNEQTGVTTLGARQISRLELSAPAQTAQLLAGPWKLKLERKNQNGVHLGNDAWYLKIKKQDVVLGGNGPNLKITNSDVNVTSAQKMKLAAPRQITFQTDKVVFGAAAIDSANLMVKADYDPTIALLGARVQTAQQTADTAQTAAEQAQQAADNAQETADLADLKAEAALLLTQRY